MKHLNTIQSLFFILLISACSNWDASFENDRAGIVSYIENEAHEKIMIYEYNGDGWLKKSKEENELFTNGKSAEYDYSFNGEGLLTEKTGFQPGNMMMSSIWGAMDKEITTTYEYYDDKQLKSIRTLVKFGSEFEDSNFETYDLAEYNEDTVTIAHNLVDPVVDYLGTYTSYVFDKNDNIEKIINYYLENNNKRITSTEEYTYDNKHAPYSFEPVPNSKNNPLTKKITAYNYTDEGSQEIAYTSEYVYEYEYNDEGFPGMKKETWPNETINITYYTYK